MPSSLRHVAYLLPIVARAFFVPSPRFASVGAAAVPKRGGIQEAPLLCVLPPVITAMGCLLLFFYAGEIYDLIYPVAFPAPSSAAVQSLAP